MRRLQLLIVPLILFISCTTSTPPLFETDPALYEAEDIKIEYRLGMNVHFIKISNYSDDELFIDYDRMSIVSVRGETRTIDPAPFDSHIPPRSAVVIFGNQETIFNFDIDYPFEDHGYSSDYGMTERSYLKQFIGQSVRLFIPIIRNGEETIHEVYIDLTGLYDAKSDRPVSDSLDIPGFN